MVSFSGVIITISSTVLRLLSYIFFRWIPGHPFPPSIVTLLIVYLTTIFIKAPSDRSAFPSRQRPYVEGKGHATAQGIPHGYPRQPKKATFNRMFVTLLSGLPDNTTRLSTIVTISINVLLALLVMDFVLRPSLLYPVEDLRFSRIGFVGSDVARILVREPDPNHLPLSLSYRQADIGDVREAGRLYELTDETDYTHPFTIKGLLPSTTYSYVLSNNVSGGFTTAPGSSDRLTFLTSSCIKARFPFNALLHPLAIRGFSHLPPVLEHFPSRNKFMLFLGDFIYVDVPWRMSSTLAHYRSEYRRVYASPSWNLSPLLQKLPWIHTWDDHEIANDWSSRNEEPFPAAADAFRHYHASVNPPKSNGALADNSTFFSWQQGPASFFLLDTRSYRTKPEPNPDATILGRTQLAALLDFVAAPLKPGVKWKFVASSVPFTKNWRVGTKDTWGGFLAERRQVLDAMHKAEAECNFRFVILSGDRHEFGAIRFPVSANAGSSGDDGIYEFSVGPLSMFYLPTPSFKQVDDEDLIVHYQPIGNSKVGVIDIRSEHSDKGPSNSILEYLLYIDGKQAWKHTLKVEL